jgi:hypothetical protein
VVFLYDGDLMSFLKLTWLVVASLSAGCANYSPQKNIVGKSRVDLIGQMGEPEREYEWQEFQKLHYPRGPAGSHTYFIYLDRNNRVARWEQVLKEEHFNAVQPGMTKDQVIDLIGVTKITNGLARDRGYLWHYRYETPFCSSFVIEFTAEDTVRSTFYRMRSGRTCKYVGPG